MAVNERRTEFLTEAAPLNVLRIFMVVLYHLGLDVEIVVGGGKDQKCSKFVKNHCNLCYTVVYEI